jgi:hypothetical protein
MIGPFDFWTTARSGDIPEVGAVLGLGAAGPVWLPFSAVCEFKEPPRNGVADAARMMPPNSRRLSRAGLSTLGAGAQVPHPVELQLLQPLFILPFSLSDFCIGFSFPKFHNSKSII